ncbi:glycosyltransferase [Rhodospirillales bacterium]|nr:glycosyltransferase [Rhodospirillales bacterium]
MPNDDQVKTIVVTQYPIAAQELVELNKRISGPFDQLSVSTIISKGHIYLIRYLRSLQYQRVVVFLNHEYESPFFDALTIVGLIIPSLQRKVFDFNYQQSNLNYLMGAVSGAKIFACLGMSVPVYVYLILRCIWLESRPRIDPKPDSLKNKHVLYLKMTLWLGIQVGGALTHAKGIIKSLTARGYQVEVVTSEPFEFEVFGRQVKISKIPMQLPYVSPRELNHFFSHILALRSLKNSKQQTNVGFIYQRLSAGNFVGVEVSRAREIPLIVEYNGSEIWLSENWGTPYFFKGLVSKIEALVLTHAHLIVTVSDVLKNELISKGYEENKIAVAPNGFDVDVFNSKSSFNFDAALVESQHSFFENSIVFTFVGTFGPWHGADIFAESIKQFYSINADESDQLEVKFVFVGDGVTKKVVEKVLAELIAAGQVLMVGSVSQEAVSAYLSVSDVCVLPTKSNSDRTDFFGSPTKLFEYIGAGKPVIASPEGQTREILAGAVNVEEFDEKADPSDVNQIAVFFEPNNPTELAQAIYSVAKNSEWRVAAGKNARLRALERHTWGQTTKIIIDAIEKIVIDLNGCAPSTRVLINALHSKTGGGVTYLKNMLGKLTLRDDLDVHLVLQEKQIELFEKKTSKATVHIVGGGNNRFVVLLLEQFFVPIIGWKIKADVTFSPANFGPFFAKRPVILLRNALAVRNVESRNAKRLYWQLLKVATTISVLGARRVISVSRYAKSNLPNFVENTLANDIKIIPHGVSSNFKYDRSVKRSKTRLLFVSDLYIQKNLHALLHAMVKIVKTSDAVIDVIGAPVDTYYANESKDLVIRLGLKDRVHFHGYVSAEMLSDYYRKCAVFIFPSTVETFGNPLVEAMSCGAVIACSNAAAMPEIACDAVAYFDPLDVDDIATVVSDLLVNEELREILMIKAVKQAKKYSWDLTADRTAKVLIEASED